MTTSSLILRQDLWEAHYHIPCEVLPGFAHYRTLTKSQISPEADVCLKEYCRDYTVVELYIRDSVIEHLSMFEVFLIYDAEYGDYQIQIKGNRDDILLLKLSIL